MKPTPANDPADGLAAVWSDLGLPSELNALAYVSDAVILSDAQHRIRYWNPAAERLYGWTHAEALGRATEEVLRYEWLRSDGEKNMVATLDRDRQWQGEMVHHRRDGTKIFVDVSLTRLVNGKGERAGFLAAMRDVTPRRQAEENLRRSEKHFRLALAHSPTIVFMHDRELRYTWVYNTREGFTEQQVLGKTDMELMPPDAGAKLTAVKRRVVETGKGVREQVSFEVYGRAMTYDLAVEPTCDESGRLTGIACAATDITELRKVQEALERSGRERERVILERTAEARQSEARYRRLVEDIPAITYRAALDEASTTLFVSPQIKELLGYTPEDYRADPDIWRKLLHPEDRERVLRELHRARAANEPFDIEYRMVARDGRIVWFRDSARVVLDEAGRPAVLEGVMADITERKRVEAVLHESEERHRQLVDLAPIAIGVTVDERLVFLNPAGARLLGAPAPARLIGRSLMDFVPSAFRDRSRRLLSRALREGRPSAPARQQFLRLDGKTVDAEVTAVPVSFHGLRAIQILFRDVTESARLEEVIAEARRREQRRIAQDLHDSLGQQLTGIALLSRALERKLARSRGAAAGDAAKIRALASEAVAQTRSLAYSLHPVEPESRGLMAALRELAERTESLFRVPCEFICRRPVPVAENEAATQLFRVAQEAVANAVNHARPTRVVIRLTGRAGGVTLTVRDDGRGFAAPRDSGGGMGLEIMRHRAETIGASLDVRSCSGAGTTVACRLAHARSAGARRRRARA